MISVLCATSTVTSKSTHAHLSLLGSSAMYGMPIFWYLKASIQVFPPSTDTSTLSMPRPPPDTAYPLTFTCKIYCYRRTQVIFGQQTYYVNESSSNIHLLHEESTPTPTSIYTIRNYNRNVPVLSLW